ncbi:hypothetical protein SDC9_66790 [bioreactor metagenome]|uniref:Uncharacterized protein n=1 Tax=bioreactor metagenome TaxID=1076179 RepID=A0A644XXG6_9ZZZZ
MKKRVIALLAAVILTLGLSLQGFAASGVNVSFVKSYMRGGQLSMQFSVSCLYSGTYSAELIDADGNPAAAWAPQPVETKQGEEGITATFVWNPAPAPEGRYNMIVTTVNIYGQTSAVSVPVVRGARAAGEAPAVYDYLGGSALAPKNAGLNPGYTTGVYLLEGSTKDGSGLLTVVKANSGEYVFELRSVNPEKEVRLSGRIYGGQFQADGQSAAFATSDDGITVSGSQLFDGLYKPVTTAVDVGREATAQFAQAVLGAKAEQAGEMTDGWFWPVTAGTRNLLVARDLSAVYENGSRVWGTPDSMLAGDKLISEFGDGAGIYVESADGTNSQAAEEPYYTPLVKVYPERGAILVGETVKIAVEVPGGLPYELTAVPSDRGIVTYQDRSLTASAPGAFTVKGSVTVDGVSKEYSFDLVVIEPHIAFTSVPPTLGKKSSQQLSAVVVGGSGQVSYSLSDDSLARLVEGSWIEGTSDGVVTLTATAGSLSATADIAVGTTKLYTDETEETPPEEQGFHFSWSAFFVGSGLALTTVMVYFLRKHNREMGINPDDDYRKKL